MPTTVNCTCGKSFEVQGESAGTVATCQFCGKEVLVDTTNSAPSAPLVPASPAVPATIECPMCAERIPARSVLCPMCGEVVVIEQRLSPEEYAAAMQQVKAATVAHLDNSDDLESDVSLKGSFLAVKTMVLIGIMVISGLLLLSPDIYGLGIFLGFVFVIPMIVSWLNDQKANHIQDAPTAAIALSNYLMALRTGRANKAYATVAPPARQAGRVETIKFKAEIPAHTGPYSIDDYASYKTFWKSIFIGPSGQTRTVKVQNVKVIKEQGDLALVEAELAVTNYPTWIYITFLAGLLVLVILILVIQKTETRKIRKILLKQNELWFIADASLEGVLDRTSL